MQVVVLAGGLATRMRPETERVPKSLLQVNGRPFIDWQIDRFASSGARSIVLCVGHLGEEIETHVRRGADRGLQISYSYDGDQLIGTGGALRRALARLESEFVVTYGDSYLPFDYAAPLQALLACPEATATMSVCRGQQGDVAANNVQIEGDWVTRYQKGAHDLTLDHIDYGAIALRRSALEAIEDGAVWGLEALWSKLARQKRLRALLSPERFYEVGSPDGRQELSRHLAQEAEA